MSLASTLLFIKILIKLSQLLSSGYVGGPKICMFNVSIYFFSVHVFLF